MSSFSPQTPVLRSFTQTTPRRGTPRRGSFGHGVFPGEPEHTGFCERGPPCALAQDATRETATFTPRTEFICHKLSTGLSDPEHHSTTSSTESCSPCTEKLGPDAAALPPKSRPAVPALPLGRVLSGPLGTPPLHQSLETDRGKGWGGLWHCKEDDGDRHTTGRGPELLPKRASTSFSLTDDVLASASEERTAEDVPEDALFNAAASRPDVLETLFLRIISCLKGGLSEHIDKVQAHIQNLEAKYEQAVQNLKDAVAKAELLVSSRADALHLAAEQRAPSARSATGFLMRVPSQETEVQHLTVALQTAERECAGHLEERRQLRAELQQVEVAPPALVAARTRCASLLDAGKTSGGVRAGYARPNHGTVSPYLSFSCVPSGSLRVRSAGCVPTVFSLARVSGGPTHCSSGRGARARTVRITSPRTTR